MSPKTFFYWCLLDQFQKGVVIDCQQGGHIVLVGNRQPGLSQVDYFLNTSHGGEYWLWLRLRR